MTLNRTVFLGSCAALALPAVAARAQALPPITIATVAVDALAVPFYAQEMGFFAKAGLNVTIQQISNGAAITAGVVSGSFDVGGSNVGSLIIAASKKLPIALVSPAGEYNGKEPVLCVLTLKSSPIKTAKDLEGKIVGTSPLGSIGQYVTNLWMDKNGGDSAKLKWIELAFSQAQAALVEGRIDAAVVSEPFVTQNLGIARILAAPYAAVGPRVQTTAYFSTTSWAQANPQLVSRFVAVMRDTAAWANENPGKSGEILAHYSKIGRNLIATMSRVHYSEKLLPALIQPTIDMMAKYKVIEAPFDAGTMLYRSR